MFRAHGPSARDPSASRVAVTRVLLGVALGPARPCRQEQSVRTGDGRAAPELLTPRRPGCTALARRGTPRGSRRGERRRSGRRSGPSPAPARPCRPSGSARSRPRAGSGAASRNGAWARPSAAVAPSRMSRHATAGATLRAANRPTACFTITVSTAAPSSSRASAASAWSPLTSATGTSKVPASAALIASSPTGRPLSRASCTRLV